MTTRNVACNAFAEVWKNTSSSLRQVTFDAPTQCGGVTTLGLYETANNALKDSWQISGQILVEVPGRHYLAVHCQSSQADDTQCTIEYSVS